MFKILDGRDNFYQWDIDRKIVVEDRTIKEVHFCNKTDDCSLVCETYEEDDLWVVDVPNILLQNDWRIRVYAYDGFYTKHADCFHVIARTKPADYVYTETEVLTYKTLEKELNECKEAGGIVGNDGLSIYHYNTELGRNAHIGDKAYPVLSYISIPEGRQLQKKDMIISTNGVVVSINKWGSTTANGIIVAILKGEKGDSAYRGAVNNGYVGTEKEWLESLKGEPYTLTEEDKQTIVDAALEDIPYGCSIYYCSEQIDSSKPATHIDTIAVPEGRTLQIGDLILTANNYLCKITNIIRVACELEILSTVSATLTEEDKQEIVNEVLSNFTDVSEVIV